MSEREWRASHGICCYPPTPELCVGCACHDENPAAATVSRAVTGVNRETMDAATTNGPRLPARTVLATPIRTTEQEDYPEW